MNTLRIRKGKSLIFSQVELIEKKNRRRESEYLEMKSRKDSVKAKKAGDDFSSPCLPTIASLNKKKFKTTFYRENNYKAHRVSTQRNFEKSMEKIESDNEKKQPLLGIIALHKNKQLPPISIQEKVKKTLKTVGSNEVSFAGDRLTSSLTSPSLLQNPEFDQKNLKKLLKSHQALKPSKNSADPYHASNLLKNPEFTSFTNLLDNLNDFQVHPFLYFERAVKIKSNPQVKKKFPLQITHGPKKTMKKKEKVPILLHIHRLRLLIPGLSRIHFHPKDIFRKMRLIIINLFDFNWFDSKNPKILQVLKKISKNFQIVFIIKDFSEILLEKCEEFNFHISGVYFINSTFENHKDLAKCLDYSQVFLDFECKNLYEDVLVVTCHLLDEDADLPESLIFDQSYQPKVYVDRIPVASLEYPEGPLVFLLPVIEKSSYCLFLYKLCKMIQKRISWTSEMTFPELFNFRSFLISDQSFYSVILSYLKINWKQFINFKPCKVVNFV